MFIYKSIAFSEFCCQIKFVRYERKLEEEIKNYSPFGRGGAGAPLRDAQGNVMSKLHNVYVFFRFHNYG